MKDETSSDAAETSLLGHLIAKPERLGDVPEALQPFHFYSEAHRWIFAAIRGVSGRGDVATLAALDAELKRLDRKRTVGERMADVLREAVGGGSPREIASLSALVLEMAARRVVLDGVRRVGAELEHGRITAGAASDRLRAIGDGAPAQAATGARPLTWLSADDLTSPVEEPKYLVDKIALAPATLCILAGQAFSGKSVVAHELALCIAANRAALGKHAEVSAPGPVALLDYEMGRALTVRRVQRLARGRGVDLHALVAEQRLRVACFPDLRLTDPDAIDRMRAALEGVSLAVVDSARAMMPAVDENDSAVRTYLDQLAELADKTHTTILLLHHAGKNPDADPRSYLRGSSGFLDAVSSAYVLTTRTDEPQSCVFRHIKCRHRGIPTEPFKLVFEDVDVSKSALRIRWEAWQELAEAVAETRPKPRANGAASSPSKAGLAG